MSVLCYRKEFCSKQVLKQRSVGNGLGSLRHDYVYDFAKSYQLCFKY
jgi:hypothetical protein